MSSSLACRFWSLLLSLFLVGVAVVVAIALVVAAVGILVAVLVAVLRVFVLAAVVAVPRLALLICVVSFHVARCLSARAGNVVPRFRIGPECSHVCLCSSVALEFADGHTASNAPDLFRPPKLSSTGPG